MLRPKLEHDQSSGRPHNDTLKNVTSTMNDVKPQKICYIVIKTINAASVLYRTVLIFV